MFLAIFTSSIIGRKVNTLERISVMLKGFQAGIFIVGGILYIAYMIGEIDKQKKEMEILNEQLKQIKVNA